MNDITIKNNDGHKLDMKIFDNGEMRLIMTSDKDESQCIFVNEEQKLLILEYLTNNK